MASVKVKTSDLAHEQFYYVIRKLEGEFYEYYENDEYIDWECCEKYCLFAMEYINGSYLVFAPELQREIVAKLLKSGGITEAELCPLLEEAEENEDDFFFADDEDEVNNPFKLKGFDEDPLIEFAKAIGFSAENGELVFHKFEYLDEPEYTACLNIVDLLKALGYPVDGYGLNCSGLYTSYPEVDLIPKPEIEMDEEEWEILKRGEDPWADEGDDCDEGEDEAFEDENEDKDNDE